jgi:hypothetical protein
MKVGNRRPKQQLWLIATGYQLETELGELQHGKADFAR